MQYKAHPWHGIPAYDEDGDLNAFIEMVPSDHVKYEIDKESGYLMIDRPQKFSNIVPALYGFVPQTYCAEECAKFAIERTGDLTIEGDGDPLDICVLTEREIHHGDLLVKARPIGGFRMLDGGEADDKIIAVLTNDPVYDWNDITDVPPSIMNRLKHYFLTYKQSPDADDEKPEVSIPHTYGKEEAIKVIELSKLDYNNNYKK